MKITVLQYLTKTLLICYESCDIEVLRQKAFLIFYVCVEEEGNLFFHYPQVAINITGN